MHITQANEASPLRGGQRLIVTALIGLFGAVPGTVAQANSLDGSRSFCETINCNATVVGGTLNKHTWNLSGGSTTTVPRVGGGPWVMPVRAGLDECLRLDILSQSTQIEMVVVSPSGVIWRNSGRGGTGSCRNCPLVKINGTSQSGYYVIQINHANGNAVDGEFKLAYGRYSRPNPNCDSPTAPLN